MKEFDYYPDIDDNDFVENITKRKEFWINRQRKTRTDCKKKDEEYSLLPHQLFLPKYINPNSPYNNLLIFHGVGSGKCVLPNTKINDKSIKVLYNTLYVYYQHI